MESYFARQKISMSNWLYTVAIRALCKAYVTWFVGLPGYHVYTYVHVYIKAWFKIILCNKYKYMYLYMYIRYIYQ